MRGGKLGEDSRRQGFDRNLVSDGGRLRGGKHESSKSQWVVEAAEGQAFLGFKEYQDPGEDPQKEVLKGAVGVDGDIRIADTDGFFTGRMTDGKILGQYIETKDAADNAVLNVEMSRQ